MSKVLVVEDEARLSSFVSRALTAEGFVVDSASDGQRGLELARSGGYSLVLLDLLLPGLDGLSVLDMLLEHRPQQRVLVLSALSDVSTRVRCLERGAVDFLTKPFSLAELIARVRARIREPSMEVVPRIVQAGRLTLDVARRTADGGDGPVALSEREFLLLQALVLARGDVLSRQRLLDEVWGVAFDLGSNVVDVCVGRLRAKLGAEAIETVRGVGYRVEID